MKNRVRALRGATTVLENDRDEIIEETARLMKTMMDLNKIDEEDMISVIFTATKDLDSEYPSVGVREILGIRDIPLLNFEEKHIVGSLDRCIRIMIHFYTDKTKNDLKPVYLNGAQGLRKDIKQKIWRGAKTLEKHIVIAVDGPAGAGKSTIAKIVAKQMNINYIDTGAMYRAVSYKIHKMNIDMNNMEEIKDMMDNTTIDFEEGHILLDGKDVESYIRTPEINKLVSEVAKIGFIRTALVETQRAIGKKKSVIMDGRDIGTEVFKNADLKVFLTADVRERAVRRHKEMTEKGYDISVDTIEEDIKRRDEEDSNREISPLKKAEDAVEVNTTGKSIEEVVVTIIGLID